jgi:hypothetical protein
MVSDTYFCSTDLRGEPKPLGCFNQFGEWVRSLIRGAWGHGSIGSLKEVIHASSIQNVSSVCLFHVCGHAGGAPDSAGQRLSRA